MELKPCPFCGGGKLNYNTVQKSFHFLKHKPIPH